MIRSGRGDGVKEMAMRGAGQGGPGPRRFLRGLNSERLTEIRPASR